MQTPLEKYKNDLDSEEFHADSSQEAAVVHLQRLFVDLLTKKNSGNSFLRKLKSFLGIKTDNKILGLYFWGAVGRGKTYLVDCFFECLPFEKKWRIHFHRFMQDIHKELK